MTKDLITINKVDVSPLLKEVVEYAKDQNAVGDLEALISKVPMKDSLDWKLISGVLCNAIIEWVAKDTNNRKDLIVHLQKEVGYLLQRLGLTM
jgi:hypothetical protein|tara:strand:+ start:154 stop:432 length:279 start_codon:yes stop_codon:yes gene_type:complete